MSPRTWLLVLLALLGCAESDANGDGTPTNAPGTIADGSIEDRPVGVFSRTDVSDAVNLELREDGTWFLAVNGCDVRMAAHGEIVHTGEGWALATSGDECRIPWYGDVSVEYLQRLAIHQDGSTLTVSGTAAGDDFEHVLTEGGMCAACSVMGPAGLAPCDLDFESAERSYLSDCD